MSGQAWGWGFDQAMPSPNLPSSEVHLKPKTLPGDPKAYRFKGSNPVIKGSQRLYFVRLLGYFDAKGFNQGPTFEFGALASKPSPAAPKP